MDFYLKAPVWEQQHDCPNTTKIAKPINPIKVRNARVIEITDAKYRGSTFSGTFLLGDQVLILDSKKKGRGRYFGIPGGKIEEGETPGNACRREIREEAGFIISEITPIGSIELIQKDHISVSYGYVARVLLSDQKQLDLTPEEQEENFKTEVLSYNQVIDLLQKQYVYHHQAATLRNLTFILEAKRVLDSKE